MKRSGVDRASSLVPRLTGKRRSNRLRGDGAVLCVGFEQARSIVPELLQVVVVIENH